MRKKKLINSKPYSIKVYGISSPAKGYKLGWSLGSALHMNFLKQTEKEQSQQYQNLKYDLFVTQNEDCETLILLENQKNGHLFFPKYKIADFFLIHCIDGSKNQVEDIQTKVKQVNSIQAIFPIAFKNDQEESLFYLDV